MGCFATKRQPKLCIYYDLLISLAGALKLYSITVKLYCNLTLEFVLNNMYLFLFGKRI